jgi:fused signal recognition particle receptor
MNETIEMKLVAGLLVLATLSALLYFFRGYFSSSKGTSPAKVREPKLPPAQTDSLASKAGATDGAAVELVLPDRKSGEAVAEKRREVEPQPAAKATLTLEDALAPTRRNFFGRIVGIFDGRPTLTEAEIENLEEVLYTSDLGPKTVSQLMGHLRDQAFEKGERGLPAVRRVMGESLNEMLAPSLIVPTTLLGEFWDTKAKSADEPFQGPRVWMIVGVNGAGKTTTIGKLAFRLAEKGHKVLVAAGDTFRAAAGEQLRVWSERAQVEIYAPEGNASPSGVAFDACKKAVDAKFDIVLLDTAGRLHTQKPLMEELKKVRRVIEKNIPSGPEETLLVVDANVGQNAVQQAREFNEAVGLTGVVLTKMDGSAKGGVALAISNEIGLPIRMIGIGEKIEDLRPFDSKHFVESLLLES